MYLFEIPVPIPNPLDFLEPGAVALLVAVLLFALVVVAIAFGKEWIVPGSAYKRQAERTEKTLTAIESLTRAFEDFVKYSKGGQ